jgi:hypothetical protein
MTAILDRVKDAVLPDRQPDVDPIAELQRLEDRRLEISAHIERILAALSSIPVRERAAYRVFVEACKTDDEHAIESALADWLAIAPQAEFARREFNGLTAEKTYGKMLNDFKRECPDAKKILLMACELRLAQAQETAAIVLADAQRRLQPMRFSADQIADDPVVRRANGKVGQYRTIQKRIEAEGVDAWRMLARELLK